MENKSKNAIGKIRKESPFRTLELLNTTDCLTFLYARVKITAAMNAIKINGMNRHILWEVDKIMKKTMAIPIYLPEKLFLHLSKAQRNKGRNAINKLLVVASHIVNFKKTGDKEKTNVTRNANRSSFFTSLANKKVKKTPKIPNNMQKNNIIYSIVISVTCDTPDSKNGCALA